MGNSNIIEKEKTTINYYNMKNLCRIGFSCLLSVVGGLAANSSVVTYPAPDGAALNKTYSVEVRQTGDTEWLPVDVYAVKVD